MTAFIAVRCASTVITLMFAALFELGWSQNAPNTTQMESSNNFTNGSLFSTTTRAPTTTISPEYLLLLQACSKVVKPSCWAPPQPVHGEWKLHPDFCKREYTDCKVPEGTELELGHELIYTCTAGYRIKGNDAVYCRHNRMWSSIPSCTDIKCDALNSVSRVANCSLSNTTTNCDFPVLPKTEAKVSCRPGYKEQDVALFTPPGNELTCNEDGKWEPRPLNCVPDCGRMITHREPLLANGDLPMVRDLPWRASMYFMETEKGKTKIKLFCGATLIREDLLLTAAHCVYDNKYGTTKDPEKLFVTMGNIFKDYDSPMNDERIVAKRAVKNVYFHYHYWPPGYNADIALVELKEPFVLSDTRLPACLDISGKSMPRLERGAVGSVAGFERTGPRAFRSVLQATTLPYIFSEKCRSYGRYRTKDKFCAGHRNGSATCQGNGGEGIVFQKNDQWYVMGVATIVHQPNSYRYHGLRNCFKDSYNLYTMVSNYTDWILQVISNEDRHKSRQSSMRMTATTPTPTITLSPTRPLGTGRSSCLVPPQPTKGWWKGHPSLCNGNVTCNILEGTELEPGSQLVYSCDEGYKPAEDTNVYCRRDGTWSSLPVCIEIGCKSLNSPSAMVDCRNRTGSWINCDPFVPPRTWASLSCRVGYREHAAIATQAYRVFCDITGTWEPDPITCVPDCGKAITQQTPFVINGTTARTGDFPWHASIYLEKTVPWSNKTEKEFICGATIIRPNLLLTAAHCVYDAESEIEQDPKKLFIMTGNIFRDYDFAWHNPVSVRKNRVKTVYRHCNYYGQAGAYASDIALLQLQKPFELSSLLLPACLNYDGHDEQILEYGNTGRVAGFGRTTEGKSSSILQTITVPYIPYRNCTTSANAEKNKYLISDDKFCAGYTNGSAVCDGDSGGGLVFQIGEIWHVMGVVSVGLGVSLDNGERTCDSYSYTLYTRVSRHIEWIREIIRGSHLNRPFASCDSTSSPFRKRRDSLHRLV